MITSSSSNQLKTLFGKIGVLKNNHFKLTKGNHSKFYVYKDDIIKNGLAYRTVVDNLCRLINIHNPLFDFITSPAVAGIVWGSAVSFLLSKPFVYPEKIDSKMEFRRDFPSFINGKCCIIVEDIITSGGSVNDTRDAVHKYGGRVSGVISIWNRTGFEIEDCVNSTLINERIDSYSPSDCPMCKEKIPLIDPKTFNVIS
jgi:orotate phosphoribosyltransferase